MAEAAHLPHPTPAPTIGVCGLGRCGSTMVMAMLDAGGIRPVDGTTPGTYERDLFRLADLDLAGRSVKLLDHVMHPGPRWPRANWRLIWLNRRADEQARSQVKFVREMLGIRQHPGTWISLAKQLPRDRKRTLARYRRMGRVTEMSFEEILANPNNAAMLLGALVWPLEFDVAAAAAVVHRRSPECLPDCSFEISVTPPPEEPSVRISFGATSTRDQADIDEACKQLHDRVVNDLGAARTGPVTWRLLPASGGLEQLNDAAPTPGPVTDQLAAYLADNPDGHLIVAYADYDPALLTDDQRRQHEEATSG